MSDKNGNIRITVFTPTYNRAHLLPRLFDSLLKQTHKDFEWVIVDDGSTDDTSSVVDNFKAKAWFPITYVKQENQGRHIAINTGVEAARGELFSIIDSDDMYLPDALSNMLLVWDEVPSTEKDSFCGVCGLLSYSDGNIVGDKFPSSPFDSDNVSIRLIEGIDGDKISLTRTDIMRAFPYPKDLGRYSVCSIVWNRIGFKYKCRFFNKVIGVVEYQEGGLTDTALKMRVENPNSMRILNLELLQSKLELPTKEKIKCLLNYARYSMHSGLSFYRIFSEGPSKLYLIFLMIPAWLLYTRDKLKVKK